MELGWYGDDNLCDNAHANKVLNEHNCLICAAKELVGGVRTLAFVIVRIVQRQSSKQVALFIYPFWVSSIRVHAHAYYYFLLSYRKCT